MPVPPPGPLYTPGSLPLPGAGVPPPGVVAVGGVGVGVVGVGLVSVWVVVVGVGVVWVLVAVVGVVVFVVEVVCGSGCAHSASARRRRFAMPRLSVLCRPESTVPGSAAKSVSVF